MKDPGNDDSLVEQIMNDPILRSAATGPNAERSARIAALNDRLRVHGRGGMVVMTNGVGALGLSKVNAIFAAVSAFESFTPDNDPCGEHDFGNVTVGNDCILWKIDYFDRARRHCSPDPADPRVTVRVLTVMLADEY